MVSEVVVAQLVERSLAILEVRGSNPFNGKIYIEHLFTINCIEKTKIKKKGPGMSHLKKIFYLPNKRPKTKKITLEHGCRWLK